MSTYSKIRYIYRLNIYHMESTPKDQSLNLRLFKSKQLSAINPEIIKLLIKFIKFAAGKLGISDKSFTVRLLHAAPNEPITTGAYDPMTKKISTIVQNRHFIDYCRTIAHEMTHQKQDLSGEIRGNIPEIGGKIEDDANIMSGRIVKEFIKTQLSDENKKTLGLGSY